MINVFTYQIGDFFGETPTRLESKLHHMNPAIGVISLSMLKKIYEKVFERSPDLNQSVLYV